jgi:energy-coupling factor transporter ATP-binding protein EcfA2
MRRATLDLAKQHGLDLPAASLVRDLSVAQQQMVEIARALSMRSRLIVMDEPTSALSETETQRLFQIVRNLKQTGISTIFVTHRLPEVLQICDRITVLRDGRPSGKAEIAGLTIDGIIKMMVGRSAAELFKPLPPRTPGNTVMEVKGCRGRRRHRSARCGAAGRVAGAPPRRSGHCRAGRLRPHRAGALPVRRRSPDRRHGDGGRQAGQHQLAARRHRRRHRPGAGGPQAAGAVPGSGGP